MGRSRHIRLWSFRPAVFFQRLGADLPEMSLFTFPVLGRWFAFNVLGHVDGVNGLRPSRGASKKTPLDPFHVFRVPRPHRAIVSFFVACLCSTTSFSIKLVGK